MGNSGFRILNHRPKIPNRFADSGKRVFFMILLFLFQKYHPNTEKQHSKGQGNNHYPVPAIFVR